MLKQLSARTAEIERDFRWARETVGAVMTDNIKDLLMRAAKNAGHDIAFNQFGEGPYFCGLPKAPEPTYWLPHLDDGDSTRLADAMGMDIGFKLGIVSHNGKWYKFTPHNLPELRMAVLRAAAAKSQP